ncbi:hypothetical protein LCGC14_2168370, partial [marine sediment metagenome]
RFDGEAYDGPMWLVADNSISCVGAAVTTSLSEIVARVVMMVKTNPDTVRDGEWTLERKRTGWVAVE